MKYALISDIHANVPALDAALADIDARAEIDAKFTIGNADGCGPLPTETSRRRCALAHHGDAAKCAPTERHA